MSRVVLLQPWMTAYGDEVIDGRHLGRTIRRNTQGFKWESNSKHVDDMVELCGLKLEAKGAPTPIAGKGRRNIDDDLEPHDAQTFRQPAGRLQAQGSTCRSIVHHSSLQFPL